eukprot:291594_1
MTRVATIAAIAVASALSADAFSVSSSMPTRPMTALAMSDDETPLSTAERGVSVDQDGKSNVWAIEPKVEVETKSSEEKTSSALFAGAGFAAFAAVAAGVLSNLPDPDQF